MTELRRAFVALAAGTLLAACLPVAAQAEEGRASQAAEMVRVNLTKDTRRALRKRNIRIKHTAVGGRVKRAIRLPVASGSVSTVATMKLQGRLDLRVRKRHARIRRLQAVLTPGGGYVAGRINGTRYTVLRFVLDPKAGTPFDPLTGRVKAVAKNVRLPRLARVALAERLRIRPARLPRKLGPGKARAALEAVPAPQTEPPERLRPGSAVDVTAAEITWRARTSWVNYLHDAPGDLGGARAKDGAIDGPPETIPPSPEARVYEFIFPLADGWYDPATDTARIDGVGTVGFFKLIDPFQLDLDTSSPELELGGERPRMIGLLNGRRKSSDQQNRRAVLVDLRQDAVTPEVETGPGGTTVTYEDIPAFVPDGADVWPIAGYYQPGDAWGSVSVEFTYEGVGP